MACTYFISDLHLTADRQDITDCFATFLRDTAPKADALYILGDLFEYWIGDDERSTLNDLVASEIRDLTEKGVPVFFIHGNRDFLVGNRYATQCNMTLLPEQAVVDLYGTRALIMHGDELCTRDEAYQRFRKKARSWWWPRMILSLPLFIRRRIALKIRQRSKESQQHMSADIMDVTPSEVVKTMQQHDVNVMIHGHTHRPAVHKLTVNGEPAERIVLGDWYEQGSILEVSPQGRQLKQLQFA